MKKLEKCAPVTDSHLLQDKKGNGGSIDMASYDAAAARQNISDESYKLISIMVPQHDFISNAKYEEWLD